MKENFFEGFFSSVWRYKWYLIIAGAFGVIAFDQVESFFSGDQVTDGCNDYYYDEHNDSQPPAYDGPQYDI